MNEPSNTRIHADAKPARLNRSVRLQCAGKDHAPGRFNVA